MLCFFSDHLISKKRHSSFTKKDIDNIVEVAQTSDKAETGDSLAVLGDRNYEELETAVLKCLTSVSYDIRCKMLKQLSTLVGEGECGLESMHGDQNQTCTCVNGKQMSKSSVSKLLKSAKLQNQLFNMIGYERQEECQLQLLGYYYFIHNIVPMLRDLFKVYVNVKEGFVSISWLNALGFNIQIFCPQLFYIH